MKLLKLFNSRFLAFSISFLVGSLITLLFINTYSVFSSLQLRYNKRTVINHKVYKESKKQIKTYPNPEHIINLITSTEPFIRQAIFKELSLYPSQQKVYYDYPMDLYYPERAENINLEYISLDTKYSKGYRGSTKATINFTRSNVPMTIVMQEETKGQWFVLESFISK
jgi:hypothetical protein